MSQLIHDIEHPIIVTTNSVNLDGILHVPKNAKGLVLFVHGSGSSHLSKRNQFVARELNANHFATLLFDLLTPAEEEVDNRTLEYRFDIDFLAERLLGAMHWVSQLPITKDLSIGLFGASTGGGASLVADSKEPDKIKAIVSRGGRPDLALDALSFVKAPVLLIVGGNDVPVIEMNQEAMKWLKTTKELKIVPGATHLFEEPGALNEVARLAIEWFTEYLS